MGKYRDGITAQQLQLPRVRKFTSFFVPSQTKSLSSIDAHSMMSRQGLNPQGIAAIDHANILYNQSLDNGLGNTSTFNSIVTQRINEDEFSDSLIQDLLAFLSREILQSREQGLLINGTQTSGNILDIPKKPFQLLKNLLIQKIDDYNQFSDIDTDKNFKSNWEKNLYRLRGWAIVMNKGGNLKPHNHESGWLTGTFYLQMPEEGSKVEEGAIEFSHQGPQYPSGDLAFKKIVMRPSVRDLNIFYSSLFHRTLPFESEKQRICIAFDVTKHKHVKRF